MNLAFKVKLPLLTNKLQVDYVFFNKPYLAEDRNEPANHISMVIFDIFVNLITLHENERIMIAEWLIQ